MPKTIHITFLIFMLISMNAPQAQQGASQGYLIQGDIKGINSGIVRILSSNGVNVLDSSIITGGRFCMQGYSEMPEQLLFNIQPGNWNFKAFVENTSITLVIDTFGAEHYGENAESWSLIWQVKQAGSELAKVYDVYSTETKQNYYVSLARELTSKVKSAPANSVDHIRFTNQLDSLMKVVLINQRSWIENFIRSQPSSDAGVFLLSEHYDSSPDLSVFYLDSMLKQFSGEAIQSVYFSNLSKIVRILRSIQPGSPAPDFELSSSDGSVIKLSSVRGKYILLDFWASWCIPCRKAIPIWKDLYSKYKEKNFTILGISSDRKRDDWIKALDVEQMPWLQLIDRASENNDQLEVAGLYGIKELPFYFFINPEGTVLGASADKDVVIQKIIETFH